MINSKLLEIISVLDAQEFHRLGLFLRSPYFQEKGIGSDELRLFAYLEQEYPHFEEAVLDKQRVYRAVFADTELVNGKLEKKMSALLKQVERFLVQQRSQEKTNDFVNLINQVEFFR